MSVRLFDQSRTYSSAPEGLLNFSGPITWACWIRFNGAVSGSDELLYGNGYWSLARQGGSGTIYSHTYNGSSHTFCNGAAIGSSAKWYHLAAAFNTGAFLNLFIDGVYQGFSGGPIAPLTAGGYVTFGQDANVDIAHACVWAAAFSDQELQMLPFVDMRKIRPGALRAYWPLASERNVVTMSNPVIPSGGSGTAVITQDSPPNQVPDLSVRTILTPPYRTRAGVLSFPYVSSGDT